MRVSSEEADAGNRFNLSMFVLHSRVLPCTLYFKSLLYQSPVFTGSPTGICARAWRLWLTGTTRSPLHPSSDIFVPLLHPGGEHLPTEPPRRPESSMRHPPSDRALT